MRLEEQLADQTNLRHSVNAKIQHSEENVLTFVIQKRTDGVFPLGPLKEKNNEEKQMKRAKSRPGHA